MEGHKRLLPLISGNLPAMFSFFVLSAIVIGSDRYIMSCFFAFELKTGFCIMKLLVFKDKSDFQLSSLFYVALPFILL